MTVIGPVPSILSPDLNMFGYTDQVGVTVDSSKARWLRPVSFQTRENYMPGGRVRFRSDADALQINLEFNNLYDRSHWNDVVSVYVDGAWLSDHDPVGETRSVFPYNIDLDFGTSDFRTIEVVLPYCAAVDFKGVTQDPRYRYAACSDRPSSRVLVVGDSISNIFYATKARLGYCFLLAELIGRQCVNMGYANAVADTHGSAAWLVGMEGVDKIVVLLGVNDFAAQVPLSTFEANYTALLEGLLANSTADIFAVTPIWTSYPTQPITIESYRARIGTLVSTIADARITVVDGLTLCTNSVAHVPDGIHPNDAGHAAMATNLAAIIG